MTNTTKLSIFAALGLALFMNACKKTDTTPANSASSDGWGTTYNLKAQVDGKDIKELVTLYISKNSSGSSTQGDTTITLGLRTPMKEGNTYKMNSNYYAALGLKVSGQKVFYDQNNDTTFNKITILKFDSVAQMVGGTFQIKATNFNTPALIHTVTDGTFYVKYTK